MLFGCRLNRAATSHQKQSLRQQLLQQRAAQSSAALHRAETLIHKHLQHWLQRQPAALICAYASVGKEINLLPLLSRLQQAGWQTALPVIDRTQPGIMRMHLWQSGERLYNNRFGIPEPAAHAKPVAADEVAVCLLPLLAFTARGERLGMGGGYYDRWLRQTTANMPRIGIACEWQRQHSLPADQWDQNIDYVCTERGLQRCAADDMADHHTANTES